MLPRTLTLLCLPLLLVACTRSQAPALVDGRQGLCPPLGLQVGEQFTLQLPANPSTGFRWQLRNNARPQLEQLGQSWYSPPEQVGMVGTSGLMRWQFRAASPGSARLILDYRRPWDDGVPVERTFDCRIKVD